MTPLGGTEREDMASDHDGIWAKYRLGDFFQFPEGRKRHEEFPGTIIHEYYQRTSEPGDYKVLREVIDDVRSIRKIEIPKRDCCVIHLRTGDIIDNSEFTVDEFLSKKRYYIYDHEKEAYKKKKWNQYVKTGRYYARVLKKLKRLKIGQVSFSYNLDFNPFPKTRTRRNHRSENNEKSIDYVQRIHDLFRKESFQVVKYERHDVDHDFIRMCSSGFFVPSGGGLSRIIVRMVKLNGKRVVKGEW
ncbi:MAG: hypothetical protein CMJ54_05640 [Planctomycetaceae bacterium]|nr:hypothetical protein [Planctomycetaceae bacterium]